MVFGKKQKTQINMPGGAWRGLFAAQQTLLWLLTGSFSELTTSAGETRV